MIKQIIYPSVSASSSKLNTLELITPIVSPGDLESRIEHIITYYYIIITNYLSKWSRIWAGDINVAKCHSFSETWFTRRRMCRLMEDMSSFIMWQINIHCIRNIKKENPRNVGASSSILWHFSALKKHQSSPISINQKMIR